MANGFCPALLKHINEIAGDNAPGRKMRVAGFLAMTFCCQNSSVSPVNDMFELGHRRTLTIKYRRRPTISNTDTNDDCEINVQPAYLEWSVPALSFRKVSFHISDDTIRQYCVDASKMVTTGAPSTQVMAEVYDLIVEHANVLLAAINRDLVVKQATEFGENASDGSVGTYININQDGSKMILEDGIIQMLQDMRENEICGDPCIVGGGLFSNYTYAQALACCNTAGIDMSKTNLPRFFFDKDTQTIWGNNSVGVFAPGSVKFVGYNQFVGSFAGEKPGGSIFTTLPMPVDEFGCAEDCLRDLRFDMQLKYIDCPTTIEVNNTPTLVQRGWQVILSKYFTLWTQPDNAFGSTDPLVNTNGTIKYFIGNTTYSGGSYGPY